MARLPRSRSVEVLVPAPVAAVWDLVTDVTRVGEWSHEARSARWTRGDGPAVGNVFTGTNRLGRLRWSRPCTVTACEPLSTFRYQTDGGLVGDRTEWTFVLAEVDGGTRIQESYRILRMPRLTECAVLRLMPSHQDRTAALAGDLVRLGSLAALAAR